MKNATENLKIPLFAYIFYKINAKTKTTHGGSLFVWTAEADRATVKNNYVNRILGKNVFNAAAAVVVLLGLVRFKLVFAVVFAA